MVGSAAAAQPPAAPARTRCGVAGSQRITAVTPHRVAEQAYGEGVTRLRGADVHVAAQPGLTQEWLERSVQQSIAHGDCDLGVQNVTVTVLSEGDGFDVQLTTPDEKAAKELLRRVQQYVGH
jgi:hypothetical protein